MDQGHNSLSPSLSPALGSQRVGRTTPLSLLFLSLHLSLLFGLSEEEEEEETARGRSGGEPLHRGSCGLQ